MTREAFIRKWLGNKNVTYSEEFKDAMREDLDKVIGLAQQQVENNSNVEFELKFCEKCFQMTNHLNNICQKCISKNKYKTSLKN